MVAVGKKTTISVKFSSSAKVNIVLDRCYCNGKRATKSLREESRHFRLGKYGHNAVGRLAMRIVRYELCLLEHFRIW